MKRWLIVIISFILLISPVNADTQKIKVTVNKCIDGDTAKFVIDKEIENVRFLAIDTPEYTTKKEKYGLEAANFTCKMLKSANKIELELDINSAKYDKYNRLLAWVWVDDVLLQEEIVKSGLGKVAYLYGDYKYTRLLQEQEELAKKNKIKIWENEENTDLFTILLLLLILIISVVLYKNNKESRY